MKDNTRVQTQRLSKGKTIALWSLQILVAAAFLMAGFAKLSGQPVMVQMFEKIGIGQWIRYVTGTVELVSAILLLVPRVVPVGAALLVCTMCVAVLTHLVKLGGSPLPALVLGCLAALILWLRFDGLYALMSKPKTGSTATNP
jgi:putative oxidoreductase